MDKTEKIKKLKRSIKKIEKSIDDLSWIKIDTMGAIETKNFLEIHHYNENAIAELKRLKYYFEEELKGLQATDENITSL